MTPLPASTHFDLQELANGIYAAIHKEGGAAYSNAGIIDLGTQTLVVDSFDTPAAARGLRTAAESLFDRPVGLVVITHAHGDHWHGLQTFDSHTTVLTSAAVRKAMFPSGKYVLGLKDDPSDLQEWADDMKARLEKEKDPRWIAGLEKSLPRARFALEAVAEFEPRYPNQTFTQRMTLHGEKREVVLEVHPNAHSVSDVTVSLLEDGIVFLGDLGFFAMQPYMGDCTLERWQTVLKEFLHLDADIYVPGHGPVGTKEDIQKMLAFFETTQAFLAEAIAGGKTQEELAAADLPAPYNAWQMGGMGRWEVNLGVWWEMLGGEG